MEKLDKKVVWLFSIGISFRLIVAISIILIYPALLIPMLDGAPLTLDFLKWLWVIVPVVLVGSWIWAKLSYKFYQYELRDDGFRKEYGVIWKKYVTIPYDRIQNVDIHRGILDRVLGLSDLRIQTAGASQQSYSGGGAEGRLPGLSHEIAERLRDELVKRAQRSRSI